MSTHSWTTRAAA